MSRFSIPLAAQCLLLLICFATEVSGLESDDFNTPNLDPRWTFVNPLGAGAHVMIGAGTGDAHLELSVPLGTAHNAWGGAGGFNEAPRVMQTIANENFELEVKFDSVPSQDVHDQGIVIEQDGDNWLRFDTFNSGSSLKAFVGAIIGGVRNTYVNQTVPAGSAVYLRITRTGDNWTFWYSDDGSSWTQQGGTITVVLNVNQAGVFVANPSTPSAFVANVDYFFDMANPIDPEDGEVFPQYTLTLNSDGDGSVEAWPDTPTYPEGQIISVTAVPDANWLFSEWSGDLTGNDNPASLVMDGNKIVTAIFIPGGGPPTGFESDDFSRHNLDPDRWTLVNPLGDGSVAMTGTGTSDAFIELSVPEEQEHQPWMENSSVRIMQPADNVDFGIEVNFISEPAARYQEQGVIVEQDADNWIRFDTNHDGSNLLIFAGTTVGGSSSSEFSVVIPAGAAPYFRVARQGDLWTLYYSDDGLSWSTAGSFTHVLTVASVGMFVGNETISGPAPAFTAVADYFFDSAAPITPEDGTVPADDLSPFIHSVQYESALMGLQVSWFTDEPALGTVEYGETISYELGSVSDGGGLYYHALTLPGLTPGTTYHFRVLSEDGLGQGAFTGDFEVVYDPGGPSIEIWYGSQQPFGQLGQPQPWVNVLGNVSDPDGVSSLSYTLNGGGPAIPLTIGPDGRRLVEPGDFNVDLATADLMVGPNTVEITAIDGAENQTVETVTINYQSGQVWPNPYSIDWATLSSEEEIQDVAHIVDGKWRLEGNTVRTVEPGYDRLIALGDVMWDDYEATVPITLHTMPGNFGVGLLFRWNGHTDDPVTCPQPHCGWEPLGDIGWFRSGRVEFYHGGSTSYPVTTGTTYWLKMRVENNASGVLYSLKVWEDGSGEPGTWTLTNQEGPSTPQAGSLMLITHMADVSFGNVTTTPVAGIPNIPPVANDDSAFVTPGGTANINVLANDTDSDGFLVPASVTIFSPPSHGSIDGIDSLTGVVTYTHDGGGSTSDSFMYTVDDNDGDTSNAATVNITITEEPPLSFISDDFNACSLDPMWSFVDPAGDGATVNMMGSYTDDAQVAISVPGGSSHQLWDGIIGAPYIVQTAADTDFTLEVKFDSPLPAVSYHEQGVVIKNNDGTSWLRFEFYSSSSDTRILAADPSNSLPTNDPIGTAGIAPLYMRINRAGNTWTQSYSLDGSVWTPAPGTGFSYSMAVSGVGCYAGNAGSNPAHTALVDYFVNIADPILDEDEERNTLAINVVGNGSVIRIPDKPSYDCNEPVHLEAIPDTTEEFKGWTGDLISIDNPDTIIMDAPKTITATFTDTGILVFLSSFTASAIYRGIEVSWSVLPYDQLAGFHVYRSLSQEGPYSRLNQHLIEGTGPYHYIDSDVLSGTLYYYRIGVEDVQGQEHALYSISITSPPWDSRRSKLCRSQPNPFKHTTTLSFELAVPVNAEISIYDLSGRLVRHLTREELAAGQHTTTWDGRDNHGSRVSAGVYFARMSTGSEVHTKKVILMK